MITHTIITVITAATLHGGIQLGAHALQGGLWTDPPTYILQGLQLMGALFLLFTSYVLAGNVIPLHSPDEPPPPLTGRSLIGATLLAGAVLSTAGSLTLAGTAPWIAAAAPSTTWPTDPVTVLIIIATAPGLMLWITACEWIRRREHHHAVQEGW